MSFTKNTLDQLNTSIGEIRIKTIEDNDVTFILESLNTLMDISEGFCRIDGTLEFYWNEIVSDIISIIQNGISGQYRIAIAGLRNTLELSCHAFFYLDHKIELQLFINENFKADKYVSTLINDYHFFKTNYIKTFYKDIIQLEQRTDSVSAFLSLTYGKLCDVVHGRYHTLTKTDKLKIEYSKEMFKKFESSFIYTASAVATMYLLRSQDFSNNAILELAKKSNTLNL